MQTVPKMKLYADSMGKYGASPFLYPVYGLGGLPESFSRLCAIHGGTYMLNTPVDEVVIENGKVVGVKSGDQMAKAPLVICDPSYVRDQKKTRTTGKTIRAICILDHPIPNTDNVSSVQIIVPQKQLGRKTGKQRLFYLLCEFRYLHHHGFQRSRRLRQGPVHCYRFCHRGDRRPPEGD